MSVPTFVHLFISYLAGLTQRCRVEDKTVRYVAEENILIKPQEVSPELMALAGQHFKRWDASCGMFISNIRDEYPDD